jgi:hypothetical protein
MAYSSNTDLLIAKAMNTVYLRSTERPVMGWQHRNHLRMEQGQTSNRNAPFISSYCKPVGTVRKPKIFPIDLKQLN